MNILGQPPVDIGPTYVAKTLSVCAPEDPVLFFFFDMGSNEFYADDPGFVDQGAEFAAGRLGVPAAAHETNTGMGHHRQHV